MKKRVIIKKSTTSKSKKASAQSSSLAAAANQDIVGLLTVLVEKLTSFEAKIDLVLSRIPQPAPAAAPNHPPPAVFAPPKPNPASRPMYKAICADCGKDCEVPFKPREDRQVYCKECFAKRRSHGFAAQPEVVKPPLVPAADAVPAVLSKSAAPAKAVKKKAAAKKKSSLK